MVEKAQWVTFVSTIVLVFILQTDKNVIICKITQSPPNDISEQQSTVAENGLASLDTLMHPVVISNKPNAKEVASNPSLLNQLGNKSQIIVQRV